MHKYSNKSASSDTDLVRAAQKGEQAAFEQLVSRYFPWVFTIAHANLRHLETAEDLAQESFIRAYLYIDKLQDPEKFAPWVGSITRNLVSRWIKDNRRHSSMLAMTPFEDVIEYIPDSKRLGSREVAEMKEEHKAIHEAIFCLPVDQREVVMLRYFEDFSRKEIALHLGINTTTVWRLLRRARISMKKSIEATLREAAPAFRASTKATKSTLALIAAVSLFSSESKAALVLAAGGEAWAAPLSVTASTGAIGAWTTASGKALLGGTVAIIAIVAPLLVFVLGTALLGDGSAQNQGLKQIVAEGTEEESRVIILPQNPVVSDYSGEVTGMVIGYNSKRPMGNVTVGLNEYGQPLGYTTRTTTNEKGEFLFKRFPVDRGAAYPFVLDAKNEYIYSGSTQINLAKGKAPSPVILQALEEGSVSGKVVARTRVYGKTEFSDRTAAVEAVDAYRDKNLPGVQVDLLNDEEVILSSVITDKEGKFLFEDLDARCYAVISRGPNDREKYLLLGDRHSSVYQPSTSPFPEPAWNHVLHYFDDGITVEGEVIGEDGGAIANAEIFIQKYNARQKEEKTFSPDIPSVKTDGEGRYVIKNIPPMSINYLLPTVRRGGRMDVYRIVASADGFQTSCTEVFPMTERLYVETLKALEGELLYEINNNSYKPAKSELPDIRVAESTGNSLLNVDIFLRKGRSVSGTLCFENGKPYDEKESIQICLAPVQETLSKSPVPTFLWTDVLPGGTYSIEGVQPGEYYFDVKTLSNERIYSSINDQLVVLPEDEKIKQDVYILREESRGHIIGYVKSKKDGNLIPNYMARVEKIFDSSERIVQKGSLHHMRRNGGNDVTDFLYKGFSPSTILLKVSADGYSAQSKTIEVNANDPKPLKVVFQLQPEAIASVSLIKNNTPFLGKAEIFGMQLQGDDIVNLQKGKTHSSELQMQDMNRLMYGLKSSEMPGGTNLHADEKDRNPYLLHKMRQGPSWVFALFHIEVEGSKNEVIVGAKREIVLTPGKTTDIVLSIKPTASLEGRYSTPQDNDRIRIEVFEDSETPTPFIYKEKFGFMPAGRISNLAGEGEYKIPYLTPGRYIVVAKRYRVRIPKGQGYDIEIIKNKFQVNSGESYVFDAYFQ